MNDRYDEITQTFPPDVPPGFPFPSVPSPITAIAPPMVYVEERTEPAEYRVLTLTAPSAAKLESELNAAAREGWALLQIIPQDKLLLLVCARQTHQRRGK